MRFAAASLVMVALSIQPAAACPQSPDHRCTKYDGIMRELRKRQPVIAITYMRARGGALPVKATRAKLLRFLTGSRWNPVPDLDAHALPVRFLDGANVPDAIRQVRGVRTVLLQEIALNDGDYKLVIEGEVYQFQKCRDGSRRLTTCLVRTDVGTLDDAEPEPDPDADCRTTGRCS